jgi:DNA-binding NtrC family response regulator
MQEIGRAISRLARSPVSVLLQGETGTGKEVIARAIHASSDRARGPFVVVDCGALAPTLIASQLFGHERGAFTGAEARREGAFETAKGGSIFLDEIGELQLMVQPALLGVLERRSFRRLGGKLDIPADVRVIAATNRDLRAEVNQGSFRADLYFRLAAARIHIPPLRERTDDIEPLVEAFAQEVTGRPIAPFSHAAMEALRGHRWSGNVRELRNVVESALALGSLSLEAERSQTVGRDSRIVPYRRARAEVIAAFEREYTARIVQQTHGNVSAAARAANMGRRHLLSLLRRHDIPR